MPQYFRHSRFQSLVRQLNFYNFRKVNRERTFWIYKHKLFHRDHPENLHLLRRRTCPGIDGRKNRFTGYTSHKKSSNDGDSDQRDKVNRVGNQSSDDESSVDDVVTKRKKRSLLPPGRNNNSKRSKREKFQEEKKEDDFSVDLSLIEKSKGNRLFDINNDMNREKIPISKASQQEQSFVVSQVAMKLEEYARKARRGLRNGGRGGIVTPPLGGGHLPSGHYYRSLLTYDDEYETLARCAKLEKGGRVVSGSSSDNEARVVSETNSPVPASPVRKGPLVKDPPVDEAMVLQVTKRIMDSQVLSPGARLASAGLIGFCMSTAPDQIDRSGFCRKILQLMSSCENLGEEFQRYRLALQPTKPSSTCVSSVTFEDSFAKNQAISVQQIWESASSRNDAMRDFRIFAVNYISGGLKQSSGPVNFSDEERAALHRTVDTWLNSSTSQ